MQRQLERVAVESHGFAIALCDRGTIDGLAYWPGAADEYFAEVASSHTAEPGTRVWRSR